MTIFIYFVQQRDRPSLKCIQKGTIIRNGTLRCDTARHDAGTTAAAHKQASIELERGVLSALENNLQNL